LLFQAREVYGSEEINGGVIEGIKQNDPGEGIILKELYFMGKYKHYTGNSLFVNFSLFPIFRAVISPLLFHPKGCLTLHPADGILQCQVSFVCFSRRLKCQEFQMTSRQKRPRR
jgi:hypothetical protein